MNVTRTYRCNLCSMRIDDRTGIGLYFGQKNSVEAKMPLSVVENHICRHCLEGVSTIWSKMHNKKGEREPA